MPQPSSFGYLKKIAPLVNHKLMETKRIRLACQDLIHFIRDCDRLSTFTGQKKIFCLLPIAKFLIFLLEKLISYQLRLKDLSLPVYAKELMFTSLG